MITGELFVHLYSLNYLSNTRRALINLTLAQNPKRGINDLLAMHRCEEFKKIVVDDPDAINRPDPNGETPLFTVIMVSGLPEHWECVSTMLKLEAERNLTKTIRNSVAEKVAFQTDG